MFRILNNPIVCVLLAAAVGLPATGMAAFTRFVLEKDTYTYHNYGIRMTLIGIPQAGSQKLCLYNVKNPAHCVKSTSYTNGWQTSLEAGSGTYQVSYGSHKSTTYTMPAPKVHSLHAQVLSNQDIQVSWSTDTQNIHASVTYAVRVEGGPQTYAITVDSRTKSLRITPSQLGIQDNATHNLTLKVQAQTNYGTQSSVVSAPFVFPTPPDPVTNVQLSEGNQQLQVSWNHPSGAGEDVSFLIALNGGQAESLASTSTTFDNILPGTTYTVGIQAVRGDQTSSLVEQTITTAALPLLPVTQLRVIQEGSGIKASWQNDANNPPDTTFEVSLQGGSLSGRGFTTELEKTFQGNFQGGITYTVMVGALDGDAKRGSAVVRQSILWPSESTESGSDPAAFPAAPPPSSGGGVNSSTNNGSGTPQSPGSTPASSPSATPSPQGSGASQGSGSTTSSPSSGGFVPMPAALNGCAFKGL